MVIVFFVNLIWRNREKEEQRDFLRILFITNTLFHKHACILYKEIFYISTSTFRRPWTKINVERQGHQIAKREWFGDMVFFRMIWHCVLALIDFMTSEIYNTGGDNSLITSCVIHPIFDFFVSKIPQRLFK